MLSNWIYNSPKCMDDDICDIIIDLYEKSSHLEYIGITVSGVDLSTKKAMNMNIPKNDKEWAVIEGYVFKKLQCSLNDYFKNIPHNGCTRSGQHLSINQFMIQKYLKTEGFYKEHHDGLVDFDNKTQRVLTFIFYLNDVSEGGSTVFSYPKTSIVPEKGKLIIFPANFCFPHYAEVPISNDKYIITGWFCTSESS